jgi:hypothetical protein
LGILGKGMVVSLATDKGVWDAVLANEKIQEFRRSLHMVDGKHLHCTISDFMASSEQVTCCKCFSTWEIQLFQ